MEIYGPHVSSLRWWWWGWTAFGRHCFGSSSEISPSFVQIPELNVGAAAAAELLPHDDITDHVLLNSCRKSFANVHKPENDNRWNTNRKVYVKIESCRMFWKWRNLSEKKNVGKKYQMEDAVVHWIYLFICFILDIIFHVSNTATNKVETYLQTKKNSKYSSCLYLQ